MSLFCKHKWEIVEKRYCPSILEQALAANRAARSDGGEARATYLVLIQCSKCTEVRILKETAP